MKDYTLSQQYALVGLDGVEAVHASFEKKATLRGIKAAHLLEDILLKETKDGQKESAEQLREKLDTGLEQVRKMSKKEGKTLEMEVTALLKADGALEEIPDLLGCDMNYTTAGVSLRTYRASEEAYKKITEGIRAEILEEGPVTLDCVCMLWLIRETGCMHQIFSVSEQEQIEQRMIAQGVENPLYGVIWGLEFHRSMERFSIGFAQKKKKLFKNPYLEGVNLMYPFLDRRQAIFIDFVILGTDVKNRRATTMAYLSEHGHDVQEVPYGGETLLKVDNGYYRVFPATRSCKFPIQGIELVPVYK